MDINRYKQFADPDCEECEGEGRHEEMTLGGDGEPSYYWSPCICTEKNVQ